ncbi:hypothetical protein Q5Y75_24790 [Ruegeria sp. 2205SS24-7]|uniref:hypothetical protein n=1 Tax=Ruegeria discodermiae TaxID=3064389 RepID=UPI0027418335|nr:hypothetical protein [Ruegeria sp. 2205SS24-7]MDP5220408.1 hypothetical protein [Ruegeria sp. 2205SS24-7]
MGVYAENNGYDKVIFLDDEKLVTAEAIKAALPKKVLRTRSRIVWYFCGHGAIVNAEEVWFLSEGRYQWSARVSVPELHDVLRTYGPGQISLFSDACQTLTRMPGGGTPIIDNDTGKSRPVVDIFRATIEGQPAFATDEDGPLFSKLITDVLAGETPDDAIDQQYLQTNQKIVSSQSLATYLRLNLPDYAALAGEDQFPEINSNFVFDTNDYLNLGRIPGPRPIDFDPKKDLLLHETRPESEEDLELFSDKKHYYSDAQAYKDFVANANASLSAPPESRLPAIQSATRSEWRQDFWNAARVLIKVNEFADKIIVGTKKDFAGSVPTLAPHQTDPEFLDTINGYFFAVFETPRGADRRKRSTLLQSQDLWMPLPSDAGENLNLVVYLDHRNSPEDGITALGWQPRQEWFGPDVGIIDPMQAIKGLLNGTLGTSMIPYLAADMRLMKHYDPIYGIVAAYLYDRVGDSAAIHRMCLFYAQAGQKVPYDLALLGELPLRLGPVGGLITDVPSVDLDPAGERADLPDFVWKQMDARDGLDVAGLGPVLQTTWARFAARSGHNESKWPSSVLPLPRDAFTAAPFTTLRGNAAGVQLLEYLDALYSN